MKKSLRIHTSDMRTLILSLSLIVALAGLVGVYLFFATSLMRVNYGVEELQKEISLAQEESTHLQIRLSEVSSLEYILQRSDQLSYTEIGSVRYIKQPHTSPFAIR